MTNVILLTFFAHAKNLLPISVDWNATNLSQGGPFSHQQGWFKAKPLHSVHSMVGIYKKGNKINTHLFYNHNTQSDTHRKHANLTYDVVIVIVRGACRQRNPIHPIVSIISMTLLHINLSISPQKKYTKPRLKILSLGILNCSQWLLQQC